MCAQETSGFVRADCELIAVIRLLMCRGSADLAWVGGSSADRIQFVSRRVVKVERLDGIQSASVCSHTQSVVFCGTCNAGSSSHTLQSVTGSTGEGTWSKFQPRLSGIPQNVDASRATRAGECWRDEVCASIRVGGSSEGQS